MRTFVSHLALLLEDEEQEIIDIWKNGFLSHFYIELFLRDGSLVALFSKTYPSFLTLKEGSTFLTKPLFNSLYAPFGSPSSGGQKPSGTRGCNRPTVLNFLPLRLSCKESSTSNQAFLLRRKDVTALRCSEPLRSKDGGASKPSPFFAGWDRLTIAC